VGAWDIFPYFEDIASDLNGTLAELRASREAHQREQARLDRADTGLVNRYRGQGGGSPEAIQAALGNYAEIHKHKLDTPITKEEANTTSDTQVGALNLKRDYVDDNLSDPRENKKLVGDLDNPAQRLVVLGNLTQQGEENSATDMAECGPSSLIGGALLSGGTDGLKDIMAATLAHCAPEHKEKLGQEMEQIQQAMKDGKLDFGHLQALQKNLYTVMQRDMEGQDPEILKEYLADKDNQDKAREAGKTGGMTIEKFMATSPALKKRFDEHGLSISHIDTDGVPDGYGNNDAEHFVLAMKNKEGKQTGVYDPSERKHGQLITSSSEVKSYADAELGNYKGDRKDEG
jgi:hypothetical protein